MQSVAGTSYYKGIVNTICLVRGVSATCFLWRNEEDGLFFLAGMRAWVGLVSEAATSFFAQAQWGGGIDFCNSTRRSPWRDGVMEFESGSICSRCDLLQLGLPKHKAT